MTDNFFYNFFKNLIFICHSQTVEVLGNLSVKGKEKRQVRAELTFFLTIIITSAAPKYEKEAEKERTVKKNLCFVCILAWKSS